MTKYTQRRHGDLGLIHSPTKVNEKKRSMRGGIDKTSRGISSIIRMNYI